MERLWGVLKWMWLVVIVASLFGLGVNLASQYLMTGPIAISPEAGHLLAASAPWIMAGLASLGLLTLLTWLSTRREGQRSALKALKSHFSTLKPVPGLDPKHDLNLAEFHDFYLSRRARAVDASPAQEVAAEEYVASLLRQGEPVLITGKPKQGKTRLAYQVLQGFPNYYLLRPLPETLRVGELDFSPLAGKAVAVLLDDLDRFVERFDPEELQKRIEDAGCPCCLVATCRDSQELEGVKEKLAPFYARLRKVTLLDLPDPEGQRLAGQVGKEWRPKEFDGTPGSILLDLQDMALRYERLEAYQQGVMKALKLLYRAGIYGYTHRRLRGVLEGISGFPEPPRHEWERHLTALVAEGFLSRSDDPVEAEDAYLEHCITDYPRPEAHFPALMGLLRRLEDAFGLGHHGVSLGLAGKHAEALTVFDEALAIEPDFPQAWNNKGVALDELGQHQDAVKAYDEAIRLRPDFPEAWSNRGTALLGLGQHQDAVQACDEAIRLRPDYPEAWYNKGVALAHQGKHQDALKAYNEALRLSPDYPKAWSNRGAALLGLGQYKDALQACDKAISLNPDYPAAWSNRGAALLGLGQHQDAVKACDEAIRLRPDYPEAWNNKGVALDELGQHQDALKACDEAIRLRPDYPEAWLGKAVALAALGREAEARQCYEKAAELYRQQGKEPPPFLQP